MNLENHQIASLVLASPSAILYILAVCWALKITFSTQRERKENERTRDLLVTIFVIVSPLIIFWLSCIYLGFWGAVIGLIFAGCVYLAVALSVILIDGKDKYGIKGE